MKCAIISHLLLLFSFPMLAQIMLPGDANNDGTANQYDLLPIGVAFGAEGFQRPGASPIWQPQFFEPWVQSLPVSNLNLGFLDSDGNGIIDSLDLDAIAFNFDSLQIASQPPPQPYLPPDTCFTCAKPDLLITFDSDTAFVTDTFSALITLRYPPNVPLPAGALGIAFELSFDPEYVLDSLVGVFPDTTAGDLMFVTATSTLARAWRSVPPGSIGFGAAGKGANAFFTTRPLGVVSIVVDDMIIRTAGTSVPFWIDASNVLIINELEQIVCFGQVLVDTTLLFDPIDPATVTPGQLPAISLQPNPAGNWLEVVAPFASLNALQLYDTQGNFLLSEKCDGNRSHRISTAQLLGGVYFLKVETNEGWTVRRFVKK